MMPIPLAEVKRRRACRRAWRFVFWAVINPNPNGSYFYRRLDNHIFYRVVNWADKKGLTKR